MKVGKLFARIIPQARGRGWIMVGGFDSSVNQSTMVRYCTLAVISQAAIRSAFEEIGKMTGADSVEDVTRPDVARRIERMITNA